MRVDWKKIKAGYYHWNDPQAFEQAIMVANAQKVKLSEIRNWSEKEDR